MRRWPRGAWLGVFVLLLVGTWLMFRVVPAGFSVNNTGPSISFFFNSVAPGSLIDIKKSLIYTGPVPAVFPSIDINQYPTPEPASILLLAGGGAAA